MKQHTEENHHHMDEDMSDQMLPDEIVDISTENNASIEDMSATSSLNHIQNLNELKTNLEQIFPDIDNNKKRTKHNAHIRNLIYVQTTKKSYTQDLILDKWLSLNPSEYSISKLDGDLFLCIVRQIVLNSRDEQCNIVDIYSRIEDRHKEQTQFLQNRINELCDIIENQNSQINELCEKFGIEKSTFTTNMPVRSEEQHIMKSDNKIFINKLSIPLTINDARRITDTFVKGLICPFVQRNDDDGYAYVLPSDVLPIAITRGVTFEYLEKNSNCLNEMHKRSIFHTRYINSIVNNLSSVESNNNGSNCENDNNKPTLFVPLGLWSDGCDTGSASKANRNLVKLTTLHFVNPEIKEEHVFPIGLGDHNGNHNYVRKKILDDLKKLTTELQEYYIPSIGRTANIQFFIAYLIQDRVEHCEFTGFSSNKGICSTLPALSCPIIIADENSCEDTAFSCIKPIQSCMSCFQRRFVLYSQGFYRHAISTNYICDDCYDWCLKDVQYVPHPDFPIEMNSNMDVNTLNAKDITFDSMKKACYTMFEKLYVHEWTQKVMKRYGQVECLKSSVIMDIYKYTTAIRAERKCDVQRPIPPFPHHILPTGMSQNLFTLDQCIVGVMHTLILNLGKHVLLTGHAILSERNNQWKKFYNITNVILKNVNKLSLSWCKCFYYNNTTNPGSTWVSENYLAFAFVCKSLFSYINVMNGEIKFIKELLWCYNSLICNVMQVTLPTDEACDKVECIARIFLSIFHFVDQKIKKRINSKIETTACVISVLSISKEMKEKGMHRNYWEGGLFGRRI